VVRRLVEPLHSEGDRSLVRGTLRPGDQVIAAGTHRVVPGVRVQEAP
jgi:multidrug efflux pump subunit AcrA (membrane-fusion protein)